MRLPVILGDLASTVYAEAVLHSDRQRRSLLGRLRPLRPPLPQPDGCNSLAARPNVTAITAIQGTACSVDSKLVPLINRAIAVVQSRNTTVPYTRKVNGLLCTSTPAALSSACLGLDDNAAVNSSGLFCPSLACAVAYTSYAACFLLQPLHGAHGFREVSAVSRRQPSGADFPVRLQRRRGQWLVPRLPARACAATHWLHDDLRGTVSAVRAAHAG